MAIAAAKKRPGISAMLPGPFYTRAEDARIKELWASHSARQIAKILGTGRSREAICARVRRLGLPYKVTQHRNRAVSL